MKRILLLTPVLLLSLFAYSQFEVTTAYSMMVPAAR